MYPLAFGKGVWSEDIFEPFNDSLCTLDLSLSVDMMNQSYFKVYSIVCSLVVRYLYSISLKFTILVDGVTLPACVIFYVIFYYP